MTENPEDKQSNSTAALELRALERMIAARSRQIQKYAEAARSNGGPTSREADFQLQAFVERSTRAMEQLESKSSEPQETRIARLEGLANALECSWSYFSSTSDDSTPDNAASSWGVLLR